MSLLRRPLHSRRDTDRPAPRSSRSAARRGFSLVEVLLVMVIFGILVSFAAPRIASMRGSNGVRGAKQSVAALAQRVRNETRLRKQPAYFYINADSMWYRLRASDGSLVRMANPVRLGTEYGAELVVSPALDSVRYDARGIGRTYHSSVTPASGGTVKLRFTSGTAVDSSCITGVGLVSACGL